jgi:hypothetical protein
VIHELILLVSVTSVMRMLFSANRLLLDTARFLLQRLALPSLRALVTVSAKESTLLISHSKALLQRNAAHLVTG